jgi:hypothetical protein
VRSFRKLFTRVKLESAQDGYFFASLLPDRFLQLLRERVGGPPETFTGLSGWHGTESTSRMVASLLTLDGRITLTLARFGIMIPGLSNFAICRKSA